MDGGGGAAGRGLHERPHEGGEQPLDGARVPGSERGAHHAGMQRVGGDAGGRQPAGQLVGEQDVGELGLVVGACAGVGPFALQVAEVDPPHGVHVGGDRDHAGRGAVVQPVQEQAGEQERREMVDGEGALEPVRGDIPGVPVPPGVVEEHIDPGKALEYFARQPPHLRLGGQVSDEHLHRPAAGRADVASRGLGAAAVPAGDRQVRAHRGQAQGSGPADASGAAGDQHRPAGHRPAADLVQVRALLIPARTGARSHDRSLRAGGALSGRLT